MAGLELRNVRVRVFVDGKRKLQEFGELAFTGFGLTGPVILTLSGSIVDALDRGQKVIVSLDLKPGLDDKKLDNRLIRDLDQPGRRGDRQYSARAFAATDGTDLPGILRPACHCRYQEFPRHNA